MFMNPCFSPEQSNNMLVSLYTIMVLGPAGVLAATLDPSLLDRASDIKPIPITSSVKPVDCADHLLAGATISGVYEIYPFTCTCGKPVLVWCDMETDGGGWTVFLNRQHQDVQLDFNRLWDDYKAGFGSPNSEYYLGNDLLHQMTYSRSYTIRLDVTLASGGYDFATYQYFNINSENRRYSANLKGSQLEGTRSANCLSQMNDRAFSTLDRDHVSVSRNCAASLGGGWWYDDCQNLNPTAPFNMTLLLKCRGPTIAVTQLQLKLRPAICDTLFKTIHLKDRNCGCAAPEN